MKYYLIAIISLLVISCTKTTEDLIVSYDIPVVSGFLSPNDNPTVQISNIVVFDNETQDSSSIINELDVYLINDGVSNLLTLQEDSTGIYHSTDSLFSIIEGEEYLLELYYKETLVTSSTKVPIKPVGFEISETSIELERITEETTGGMGPGMDVEEIELTWTTTDDSYYLVKYEYLEDEYDLVNEVIEIDDPEEFANFTSSPIQDSLYTFRSMQFHYFGQYNMILFKIADEYAAVYESLNQSSLDDLTEPITNIENGKGIFASFNSDTLSFNVVED